MIKKYNKYINEEINWRKLNPFNKNKHYPIHENSDIDPYGEEDWDIDNLSPILQMAKNLGKPYDQIIELICSNKQLTSLEGIENLINLERLYCGNNQLTSLDGIENLTRLRFISCWDNQITSLAGTDDGSVGLENLTNLERLYCWNNQLTSLEGIENLTNLKVLDCRYNRFTEEYKKHIRDYYSHKKIFLSI